MKETKQANRPLEMFKRIDDSTNFSELIERDEWPEVRAMIILSVQSYDSNNKKIEALLEAAHGYLGDGHEPTDSDVHQENKCRQCKLEKAIALALTEAQ